MSLLVSRILLVLFFPFIVVWSFLSTLFREIVNAFWYAQNEVRQDFSAARRVWRDGF